MKLVYGFAVVVAGVLGTSATAATIVNEAAAGTGAFPTGGDYANAAGATTNDLGNLRLGENQINGILRASQVDPADWFFFTVRNGFEVTDAKIETLQTLDLLAFQILDAAGSEVRSNGGFNSGDTVDAVAAGSPLGAGTYNFGLFFAGTPGTTDIDYKITANLREIPPAIPLPAGLPLVLAGVGGFTVLRRSRSQKR